jgi:GWxTD domain-containing protein
MGGRSLALIALVALVETGWSQQPTPPPKESDRALVQEETQDYFRKWLEQDVVYIITEEEEDVFLRLTNDDERERFIEQFWRRRDSDLRTAVNEFKEEHYRRIAYANDHFFSAKAGWRTDRGRTYILWGPPDDREMRPSGGRYERLIYEGGGTTTTYPFERWIYRHIPGIGSDIELEFVDQSGTGEYRLALGLEEKDALLHSEGGLTMAEQLGMMDKSQRPYFTPSSAHNPFIQGITGMRAKDRPFARMARYFDVQRAPEILYKDLQKLVDSRVIYHNLPFDISTNAIKLDDARVLIAITIEVRNQDLTFQEQSGIQQGRLRIYGRVLSVSGRMLTEFEQELAIDYEADEFKKSLTERSVYQNQIAVPAGLYKLTLILEDLHGERMGSTEIRLPAPQYDEKQLAASLILAESIQKLGTVPDSIQMFVLGDLKVIPNVNRAFASTASLPVYLQVYNLQVDQALARPAPEIVYEISRNGKMVKNVADTAGQNLAYFSPERAVFVQYLDLDGLPLGDYSLRVTVRDGISRESAGTRDRFKIQ